MTHPTDFRALCAELVDEWDSLPWEYDWKGNPVSLGESVDLDFSVVDRARAALSAAPQQGAPTDEAIRGIAEYCCDFERLDASDQTGRKWLAWECTDAGLINFARTMASYSAHPAPVPVAERLPDRSDCDDQGRLWWLMESVKGLAPPTWALGTYRVKQGTWKQTHWLPYGALPLPELKP